MKAKFKESKNHITLMNGDVIKARKNGNAYIFQVVATLSVSKQYALTTLYTSRNDWNLGCLSVDGKNTVCNDELVAEPSEIVKNLQSSGFTDIEKTEFTLVEE